MKTWLGIGDVALIIKVTFEKNVKFECLCGGGLFSLLRALYMLNFFAPIAQKVVCFSRLLKS